jgi:hypothetical protein
MDALVSSGAFATSKAQHSLSTQVYDTATGSREVP